MPGVNARILTQLAFVAAMSLMLGSMLAPNIGAEKIAANGASIAKRVGAQKDLCEVGGGTFESNKTAFGSTITKCTGGTEDGRTCVNTEKSTDCHQGLVRPDEGPYLPPTGGVFDEWSWEDTQPIVVNGDSSGEFARAGVDDDSREANAKKGKDKKHKSKKGKAGGKRRG